MKITAFTIYDRDGWDEAKSEIILTDPTISKLTTPGTTILTHFAFAFVFVAVFVAVATLINFEFRTKIDPYIRLLLL